MEDREETPSATAASEGVHPLRTHRLLGALCLLASVLGVTVETQRLEALESWRHREGIGTAAWLSEGPRSALDLGRVQVPAGARLRVTRCGPSSPAMALRVLEATGGLRTVPLVALAAPPEGCAEAVVRGAPGTTRAWLLQGSRTTVLTVDVRTEGALSPWTLWPLAALLAGVLAAVLSGGRREAPSTLAPTGVKVSLGWSLLALLGSNGMGYLVAAGAGLGAQGLLASVFVQHGVLIAASVLLLRAAGVSGGHPLPGFGPLSRRAWVELVVVAGALLAVAWAVSRGLGDVSESPLARSLELVSNRYVIAYTALLAPLAEELYFRGALQAAFGRAVAPVGVVASAAVFVGMHAQQLEGAWLGLLPIGLLALANGWLRVRTRGLSAPWLVHTAYNAALVFSVLGG
ncbi:MAG: CPBP family intramembrane metalloprotease [Deltaproteobacteria bacterium]|nr:CPBP family intramembrane metalloprotease [Deltaproteobacteria bacterium]